MPIDVSAALPQLDLLPGTTITVTLDDPGAVVTSLALHGFQTADVPESPDKTEPLWLPVPVSG